MTDHPKGIQRFRRKPEERRERGMKAAQYHPGKPLDDLLAVAQETDMPWDKAAAVAEVSLDGAMVLLVRWTQSYDEHPPEASYTVVKAGDWLCYSETYDNLTDDTTEGIAHWYEPIA